ncbi:MAG TPA: hypothetical protein VIJ92_00310 [Ginsengibacter sp.]
MKNLYRKELTAVKNYFFLLVLVGSSFSCSKNLQPNVIIQPANFKIQIPTRFNEYGILINTYWGKDSIEHTLYWDNHSPCWADFNIIKDSATIKKSQIYNYRTTTAEGALIQGDVYICNKIALRNVAFFNIPFYNIAQQKTRQWNDKTPGVFGEELINKGIWKIDFKNETITFTSSMDSLKELAETNLLPSRFKDDIIELEISFRHHIEKTLEVDMGYNGGILIPLKLFTIVSLGNKKTLTDTLLFSTPGRSENVLNHLAFDSVKIGNSFFPMSISSNQSDKEMLIGARFFKQFEFVIFDYINKAVYVSRKKL